MKMPIHYEHPMMTGQEMYDLANAYVRVCRHKPRYPEAQELSLKLALARRLHDTTTQMLKFAGLDPHSG